MPFAKVNDINMYYEIHGEGEPHVFISGAGGGTKMLDHIVPIFSSTHKFVLFDTRGAGQSDKPDAPYKMEMMANDLAGLLDIIGIQSAHIRGSSMGGMIAQHFVLQYPERVRSLILACTSCGSTLTRLFGTEMKEYFDLLLQDKVSVSEFVTQSLKLSATEGYLNDNSGFIKWLSPMTETPLPSYVWKHYFRAMSNHDTYDKLQEIKVPTLVLHGEMDNVIPAENARIMASQINGAELTILPNTGHILLEAGSRPTEIVLDFLNKNSEK